jgi:hypothetical protein
MEHAAPIFFGEALTRHSHLPESLILGFRQEPRVFDLGGRDFFSLVDFDDRFYHLTARHRLERLVHLPQGIPLADHLLEWNRSGVLFAV